MLDYHVYAGIHDYELWPKTSERRASLFVKLDLKLPEIGMHLLSFFGSVSSDFILTILILHDRFLTLIATWVR